MKVIVVGSSHGGFEAVQELLETRNDVEIQWYEQGDYISFMSWGMHMYLEGAVKHLDTIRYATKEGMEEKGVKVFKEHQIISINPKEHEVEVKDLRNLTTRKESYDKLILSVGSYPFIPKAEGIDLENISTFGGRDNAELLRYKTVTPDIKEVVVVGGGYIGVEAAISFASQGKHVTIIDVLDRPLDIYLDEELTNVLSENMKANGVDFRGSERVVKYEGKDGKVSKVITDKGEYSADFVVISAGVRPNTEWLKGTLDMDEKGFILTDDYMMTSESDIFAVGNATLVKYNPTDDHINISLATNARKQGRFAAKNLDGKNYEFKGVQGTSALRVFDYKMASTGLNNKSASRSEVKFDCVYLEVDDNIDYAPADWKEKVYAKLYFNPENRVVLGAQILSKADMTEMMNTMSVVVMNKMTVDDLAYADFFFQPTYNHPWSILNQLGLEAQRKLR